MFDEIEAESSIEIFLYFFESKPHLKQACSFINFRILTIKSTT